MLGHNLQASHRMLDKRKEPSFQLHAAIVLVGTGLSQAVQGGKGGRRDSFRKMEKRASHASLDGLPNGESAASTSLQTSTGERQALLNRLEGSEEQRGDLPELLAASAKVLQDAGRSIRSWGLRTGKPVLYNCILATFQSVALLTTC